MDINFYRVSKGGIFDRIAEQVAEDLAKAVFISDQTGRRCTTHHDSVRGVHLVHNICTLVESPVQIYTLLNVLEPACLPVGDVEQVSVQPLQFLDLRFHLRKDGDTIVETLPGQTLV